MLKLVLAVVAGMLVLPDFARGDDFFVSTTTDAAADGECAVDCTLRDAVDLSGGGGDTVHLGVGTYDLTEGQLFLEGNFSIDGAGARSTTIRSNGSDRVGYVTASSSVAVTDLKVTGGRAGSTTTPEAGIGGAFGVDASGDLVVIGVTLDDNAASRRGGAIGSLGDLSFVESTASGNRAGTFPTTPGLGGAIWIGPDAGSTFLFNSTLSGNTAITAEGFSFGGGLFTEDTFQSQHVTIADNTAVSGGGLFQDADTGAPSMHDTLLAGNTGGACAGTLTILVEDHNLADDTTCDFDGTGDFEVADAKIGDLANNGGQTDTHGLLDGSPAIDAARPDFCNITDQRGVLRPQTGPCAIGAFEGVLGTDFTVTALDDNGNGVCSDTPTNCTLRDALLEAGPDDAVILPAGHYIVEQGPLTLVGDTIAGAGARTTTIEADSGDRVLHASGGDNEVAGVTITGGQSPSTPTGIGGGVLVQGADTSLLMSNTTVTDNDAFEGGGVANIAGTLTIIRSTISGNRAGAATQGATGGGLWLSGGTTSLANATVSGNISSNGEVPDAEGGGIAILGGALTTRNVTIASNQSDDGDAIHRSSLPATIMLSNTIVAGTCSGGPFGGDHNVVSTSSCGASPKNPLLVGLADNGGQTNTHALQAASPAIDAAVACDPTDQRGATRRRACDAGSYEFTGTLPSGPPSQPPPPPPDDDLPDPVPHKNVNALPKSGTVKVKLPGSSTFVVLDEDTQIPLGTTVDVRRGRVTIVAAAGTGQTADFYGGIFKLSQTKGAKPITVLTLVEKLTCAKKSDASAAAKKKRKRRLWGNGKGRFRTKGRHSAATVVGTRWLVQDTCTTTLTRVVRGRVRVRDFVKKKTVTVKAGKQYVARARR